MKCRTEQKPLSKFPMKLKSKPSGFLLSFPVNIKGSELYWRAWHCAECSWEGQGSFAAVEMEMSKSHFVPVCPAGLEMKRAGRSAAGSTNAMYHRISAISVPVPL